MDNMILSAGVAVASYGPRVLHGTSVEPPVFDEKPEFWGVYERDGDQWSHVADAPSEKLAERVAQMVADEVVDKMDVAYLAIGAASVTWPSDAGENFSGGQLELVSEAIVALAPLLARLWREIPDGEFPGVWVYGVAEPLAAEYAASLLHGESLDVEATAKAIIAQVMGK